MVLLGENNLIDGRMEPELMIESLIMSQQIPQLSLIFSKLPFLRVCFSETNENGNLY